MVCLLLLFAFSQETMLEELQTPGIHLYKFGDFSDEMLDEREAYKDSSENHYDLAAFTLEDYKEDGEQGYFPYFIAQPEGYDPMGTEEYPVVIAFHGVGGGSNLSEPTSMAKNMAIPSYRTKYPCFIISPRFPGRSVEDGEPTEYLHSFMDLLDSLKTALKIDSNRIYITGFSMGGGTVAQASRVWPTVFAAASQSAGNGSVGSKQQAENLPFWNFIGTDDGSSNPQNLKDQYDTMFYYGAMHNLLHQIDGGGHTDSYQRGTREVVSWLFSQDRRHLLTRPKAVISGTHSGVPTFNLSLDGSSSEDYLGNPVASYRWEFASCLDSLRLNPEVSTGASFTKEFTEVGSYVVRLVVIDQAGDSAAICQTIEVLNEYPTAKFTATKNYEKLGKPMLFDAGISLDAYNSEIETWEWTMGDGSGSVYGEQVSHTYPATGTYTVNLEVTTFSGFTDTYSQEVTVTNQFPGYRYMQFVGTQGEVTYKDPSVEELAWFQGSKEFPATPLAANQDQGCSVTASASESSAYEAFDKDPETGWGPRRFYLPNTLTIDMGEDNYVVPTQFYFVSDRNRRSYTRFYIMASVDSVFWDTLYQHPEDGASLPDITLTDYPFAEITSPGENDTVGKNSLVDITTEIYNMPNISEVLYYADGALIGSASEAADDFLFQWNTDVALGVYPVLARVVYNGTSDTLSTAPVNITILETSVFSDIVVTPEYTPLLTNDTLSFHALAIDQYGNTLPDQPSFAWSVLTEAGSIDTSGLYTAGTIFGEFNINVEATDDGNTIQNFAQVKVVNPDDLCEDYFLGTTLHSNWDTLDLDNWTGSSVSVDNGILTIEGRGSDLWGDVSEFMAIKRDDLTGDFDVSVKVLSQSNTHDNAGAGIIVANNFDDLSEGGFIEVYTRPSGQYRFQYDRDGTVGEINKTSGRVDDGIFPVWLRLKKEDSTFTAYYKTDATADWTQFGDPISPQLTAENSEVAIFMNSRNTSETGIAEFAEFKVANCVSVPTVTITSPVDDAVFNENDDITLQSSIVNMTETVDKVIYFANGSLLGESTTADTYDYAWNSVGEGDYAMVAKAVYNTNDTLISAPVNIQVQAASVLSSINITPESFTLDTNDSQSYTAQGLDQYGTSMSGVSIQWSLNGAGSLSAEGVLSTDSVEGGPFYVIVEASYEGVDIVDSVSFYIQAGEGTCGDEFDAATLSSMWKTRIGCEDGSGDIYVQDGKLMVEAAGSSCNNFYSSPRNYFNGVITQDKLSGDFDVVAKISSATASDDSDRAGIMIGSDIASYGTSGAMMSAMVVRPAMSGNYLRYYYDSNDDGWLNSTDDVTPVQDIAYPLWLRVKRSGSDVTGYYSYNKKDWHEVGTRTFSDVDVEVGLVAAQMDIAFDYYDCAFDPNDTTVEKQTQTITFDSIPDKLTTDASFTVNATASSGLDVRFIYTFRPCKH